MSAAQSPQATNGSDPGISLRLSQFLALRAKIAEMRKRHDAELKPLNDALLMLNGVLLEHLNATGVDSVAIRDTGTFYRTIKKSATVADAEAFRAFIRESGRWELADLRANAPAVEAFITEGAQLPPGVNFRQVAVVGVRTAGAPAED